MRIAAIDIGTNSVHMIVVNVRPDLSFEIIDREKSMVRLGAGGLDGRALTVEAMTAAVQTLSTFKRLADSHRVEKIVAVATSATREARNGGEFLARIQHETGIRPMVITGTDEARLIHQAAVYGVDVGSGRAVVIDIGGGSVEITHGTATSIDLATAARGAAPAELRNLRISAKQLRRVRKEVCERDIESRLKMPGLDPRRADLVVAGAILLDTILRRLGADELTLCDLALREGLVLDYVRRHKRQIAQVDRIPDVRRRSTIELAERCNYVAGHAQHVARLALAIFDQTRSVHGLRDRERDWLEYGGLLHDIGVHISYERHNRHSYYLIKNGDLRGFEPDEIDVIALVARYHRRGTPKRAHEEYASLSPSLRRTVRTLASILRVAESLDRSHAQVISHLEVQDRGDEALLLQLRTSGDAELEIWAASRHMGPFEQLVQKRVQLSAMPLTRT